MNGSGGPSVYHYTNLAGYNAIRSQPVWHFLAQQPPGNHPVGAYFTTLPPGTRNLAQSLLIPRSKVQYVFEFEDVGDLTPLPGGRGLFILFSRTDYQVDISRQRYAGVA